MAYYRVYMMDEAGHIRHVEEVEVDTDDEAVAFALKVAPAQRVEVWNRNRLVQRIDPGRRQAAT